MRSDFSLDVTPEKDNTASTRRIQVRVTCGEPTMASEPARTHLHWAILSLVHPATFGHTIACRNHALAFSAVIHFAMKRSAPYVCMVIMLIHPRQREGQESWGTMMHRAYYVISVSLKGNTADVHRRPEKD